MSNETKNSTAYLFESKSPLVFRTGRPFDQAGDPVSLDFPLPSTIAGACRTAIGDADNMDFSKDGHTLKNIPVHGPLAALITQDGAEPLFPKPEDAVYMRKEKTKKAHSENKLKTNILQLRPQPDLVNQDTWSDLSDLADGLYPVGLPPQEKSIGKPYKKGASW